MWEPQGVWNHLLLLKSQMGSERLTTRRLGQCKHLMGPFMFQLSQRRMSSRLCSPITSRPPSKEAKYFRIREAAKFLARTIDEDVPPGPDRTAAVRKIREAVMTANAPQGTRSTVRSIAQGG